jgi:hypothetical protein
MQPAIEDMVMDSDQAHPQRHFDSAIPESIMSLTQVMWQTPMMISTAWWNAMFDAYRPSAEIELRHAEPHKQLVIPEPIEADGEHIFA